MRPTLRYAMTALLLLSLSPGLTHAQERRGRGMTNAGNLNINVNHLDLGFGRSPRKLGIGVPRTLHNTGNMNVNVNHINLGYGHFVEKMTHAYVAAWMMPVVAMHAYAQLWRAPR